MTSDSDFALPRVEITGRTTHEGQPWYKVSLGDSEAHSCIISGTHLDKVIQPVIDAARNLGFAIASRRDREKLVDRVSTAINGQRGHHPPFAIATQIGWTANFESFVTPQQCYGRPVHVVGTADLGVPDHSDYSRSEGSLRDWQSAFRKSLVKNPLFVFGACVALMPPLLALSGLSGCMIVFTGSSSLGKTTLLDFIGSIRGGKPNSALGFQESFRASANYLETYGHSANDSVLVIDDVRSAPGDERSRAKLIEEAIYLFASGRQKGRRDGSGRPRSFRTVVVTSDNYSLKALLARGGLQHDPSMDVRLIQIAIPPTKGVINEQELTREQRSEQINVVREASHRHHGLPLHKFLKRLLKEHSNDPAEFRLRLKARIDRQVTRLLPDAAENTIARSADYFGLAYAAGCFAIKHGILPVTKAQLQDAIAFAYELHLAANGSAEAADPVSQLRETLQGKVKDFVVLPVDQDLSWADLKEEVGFRKKGRDGDFVFTKAQFDRMMPPGTIRSRMCDALLRRGLLNHDKGSSKATVKDTKKVRIGKYRKRFYCISARIMGDDR